MTRTSTFTSDNVGNPESVTADGICKVVTIREQAAAGTQNYNVYSPFMTSNPFTKVAGESTTFEARDGEWFLDGQIVGYIATASSSITFSKICY